MKLDWKSVEVLETEGLDETLQACKVQLMQKENRIEHQNIHIFTSYLKADGNKIIIGYLIFLFVFIYLIFTKYFELFNISLYYCALGIYFTTLLFRHQESGLHEIGITKAEREQYRELLKTLDLGLEDRLTARVGLLSGGQRQALTLLMATMNKPKLLLLDEHTAALDPKTALKVLTLSAKIVEENHLTTMMITHNMKDAIKYGNRLIMMYEGHIIYDVSGEEKKNLHVSDLLAKFQIASGGEFANDRMILSN